MPIYVIKMSRSGYSTDIYSNKIVSTSVSLLLTQNGGTTERNISRFHILNRVDMMYKNILLLYLVTPTLKYTLALNNSVKS